MYKGKLSKKDIKAIEKGIKKYNLMAMGCLEIDGNIGPRDCDLCLMYWENACRNCPISIKTDAFYCRETPYMYLIDNYALLFYPAYVDFPEFGTVAKALEDEIEFLISLLPDEHHLRQIQE